jgi:hypothetical protein
VRRCGVLPYERGEDFDDGVVVALGFDHQVFERVDAAEPLGELVGGELGDRSGVAVGELAAAR